MWIGGRQSMGYGVHFGRLAHRVAWESAHGPIPKGLMVCHTCDTPACVNPSHLLLGTQTANVTDAQRKGRIRHGEAHPAAKLSAEIVAAIRTDNAAGLGYRRLAAKYGVAQSTLQALIQGRTWKSATEHFEGD
jgi:hypothetical protein